MKTRMNTLTQVATMVTQIMAVDKTAIKDWMFLDSVAEYYYRTNKITDKQWHVIKKIDAKY